MTRELATRAQPHGAVPAQKQSLTADAYARIKREIMENKLTPGFTAMETDLAARLGISRTPMREALVKLAEEGLIEVKPRRGMRVLPISVSEMRDIYDLLLMLEPECAASLARDGLSDRDLKRLSKTVDEMAAALTVKNLKRWAVADDRFHRLHLDFGKNRRLAKIVGQLLDQAHRVRMFTLQFREVPTRSTDDHALIVERLRARDVRGVRALYRKHRKRAAIELFDILERFDQRTF
ncbi:MAG: GntR family transcriptional regulator [Pseudomonadota bacterium]